MPHRMLARAGVALVAGGALLGGAGAAAANPIKMPTLLREIQMQRRIDARHYALAHPGAAVKGARDLTLPTPSLPTPSLPSLPSPSGIPSGSTIQPPAPPCPENGKLPSPLSNCGLPELPATTLPFPGNMAYWGGHVQTSPKVYIVYWGWGESGAFPGRHCVRHSFSYGGVSGTLACDPDGAGRRMADFVSQIGGSQWAGVQDQYYETNANGTRTYITDGRRQLGGVWADDTNNIAPLAKTNASNPPGKTNTYTDLAVEAARAVKHFGITDLANANIVVAQPPAYSDPNALASGYCAFHDYTLPKLSGGIYDGLRSHISYTNMPYALAINSNGANVCGENAVRTGPQGKLDGFTIVLGHEIEETVTDPGAEDIVTNASGTQTYYGGWYDAADANENGDKCAWVGEPLFNSGLSQQPTVTPVPGALGTTRGNRGGVFAVQSLWSNDSAEGAGYCAGAGTDLPTG